MQYILAKSCCRPKNIYNLERMNFLICNCIINSFSLTIKYITIEYVLKVWGQIPISGISGNFIYVPIAYRMRKIYIEILIYQRSERVFQIKVLQFLGEHVMYLTNFLYSMHFCEILASSVLFKLFRGFDIFSSYPIYEARSLAYVQVRQVCSYLRREPRVSQVCGFTGGKEYCYCYTRTRTYTYTHTLAHARTRTFVALVARNAQERQCTLERC